MHGQIKHIIGRNSWCICESGEVELGNYSFVVDVILCGKQ